MPNQTGSIVRWANEPFITNRTGRIEVNGRGFPSKQADLMEFIIALVRKQNYRANMAGIAINRYVLTGDELAHSMQKQFGIAPNFLDIDGRDYKLVTDWQYRRNLYLICIPEVYSDFDFKQALSFSYKAAPYLQARIERIGNDNRGDDAG